MLAHPSYPSLIRQLSSDEAILLRSLWRRKLEGGNGFSRQWTMDWDQQSSTFSNRRMETDEFPRDNLSMPNELDFYIEHLYALGLAAVFTDEEKAILAVDGQQVGTRAVERLRLTPMGNRFVAAVCGVSLVA